MAQKQKKKLSKKQFKVGKLTPTTWQDLLRFIKWMVRTLEVPASMAAEFLVETSDGAIDDAIVEGIKTALDTAQEEDIVDKAIEALDNASIDVKDFDRALKTTKALLTPWFKRDFSDKVAINDFANKFSMTKLGAFFNKLAPGPKIKVTTHKEDGGNNNMSTKKPNNNNKKTNHPEWYLKGYSNKIKTGLNWLQSKSSNLRVDYKVDDPYHSKTYYVNGVPSIMSLDVFENAMFTSPDNTHINVAIDKIYATIRHANSGAINYSPTDLRDYLMTYNAIIAAIENFIRLYKASKHYDTLDRAVPWQIFKLSGMRWSSFRDNLSRFESDLSQLMYALNSYRAPKLALFDRTKWLYSSLFKDSNDVKSNYYQFTLNDGVLVDDEGFTRIGINYPEILSYRETSEDTSVWINQGWEYEIALNQLEQLINTKLITWRNGINSVISGDILKAFGNETFKFSSLKTALPIVYDEYVLQQIENASILGNVVFSGNTFLMPPNYQAMQDGTFGEMFQEKALVDSYKDNLSLGETFSITRLIYCAPTNNGEFATATGILPDKIITSAQTIVPTRGAGDDLVYRQIQMINGGYLHEELSVLWYSVISRFGYHPKLLALDENDATFGVLMELNNFAIIENSQLSTLHEAANTSLLYVDDKIREPFNLTKLTDLITD